MRTIFIELLMDEKTFVDGPAVGFSGGLQGPSRSLIQPMPKSQIESSFLFLFTQVAGQINSSPKRSAPFVPYSSGH